VELQPGIPQGKSSLSWEYFLIKNALLRALRVSAVRYPNFFFHRDTEFTEGFFTMISSFDFLGGLSASAVRFHRCSGGATALESDF